MEPERIEAELVRPDAERAPAGVGAWLPEEPVAAPRAPEPAAPEAPLLDDGQRTTVMAAVDLEALGIDTGNTDGKKTQTMDAIDVSMITGRASSQIGIGGLED